MKNKLYRFRSIEGLIGEFKELETQSIYFAKPNELNDPMEGFRDLYWDGDSIVWKNLFRHYLLCLDRVYSLILIDGENRQISKDEMLIFSGDDNFPTKIHKEIFNNISNNFFENPEISTLIKAVSERTSPVRKNELYFYLSSVHLYAFKTIENEYIKRELIAHSEDLNSTSRMEQIKQCCLTISLVEKELIKNEGDESLSNDFFTLKKHENDQIALNLCHRGDLKKGNNRSLLTFEFSEVYIEQIEKLVFPEWYTACFMSECKSSSVWGHYGDNHSGACLIFNAEIIDENPHLNLKGRNGSSKYKFYPIDYITGYGQINFFRMLGCVSNKTLYSMWYSSNGVMSTCASDIIDDEKQWKANYWEKFYRDITIKSKDWKYENEHRLILASGLSDLSDPFKRSLTYDFRSLNGIIFGIKTKMEDKLKVIKIIEGKFNKNEKYDFKFYQAHYCPVDKCITHTEINILIF